VRVALIVDRVRPGGGGLERYLRDLGAFLASRGDAVTLVSLSGSVPPAGWRGREVPVPRLPRGAREFAFARAVERLLQSGAFETSLAVRHVRRAHVYEPHGGSVRATFEAREEVSTRPALSRLAHRLGPRGLAFRSLERSALARSRALVAVSEKVRAELEQEGAPLDRTRVLPLGVDLARFSPGGRVEALRARAGARMDEAILLFVGGEFDLKGLPRAIETLAALEKSGRQARLVVLGSGRPRERVRAEERARALGVGGRAFFAGSTEDPAPWYRGADLLLHPTRYDACSLAVLESLACGTPVVTTPSNGAVEGRSDGYRIVEEAAEGQRLAQAVAELLEEGEKAREAARSAVEHRAASERHARLRDLLAAVAGPLGGGS
jgi:UDP-glucose:(heptosyl)LPS alpha-1,3-glucosyltransferase